MLHIRLIWILTKLLFIGNLHFGYTYGTAFRRKRSFSNSYMSISGKLLKYS